MSCAILLDLDGTLIDSYPGILASSRAALSALGHDPDQALDVRNFIGPPLEDVMRILLQPYGDSRVTEATAAYRRHYGESGLFECVPYPGVAEALEAMAQMRARIYLATSKREVFARRILDHLKLAKYFDGIYGSGPNGELDFKHDLLAYIVAQRRLPIAHTVMVGDRRYDMSAARTVGMRRMGVLWGYGTREELDEAGAERVIGSTVEMAPAVASMMDGASPGSR